MYPLCLGVYHAPVTGSIKPSEFRMRYELGNCLLGQVAVPAADMDTPDAQFTLLSVTKRMHPVNLEDHVCYIRERRSDSYGFAGPQTLAAGVGACLGRAICVDDLPPIPCPRLDESIGKR